MIVVEGVRAKRVDDLRAMRVACPFVECMCSIQYSIRTARKSPLLTVLDQEKADPRPLAGLLALPRMSYHSHTQW